MAVYENAEIRQGGNVIRVNVDLDASFPLATGSAEWRGTLQPPNNTGLALGESYTLVLPGFSPARILITSEANAVDGSVTFEGVGEMPVSRPPEHVHDAK